MRFGRILLVAAAGLLFTMEAGCSGPASSRQDVHEQIRTALKSGYQTLIPITGLAVHLTIKLVNGPDVLQETTGDGKVSVAATSGQATLVTTGASSVTVRRDRETFSETPRSGTVGGAVQNLVTQGRSDPSQLPQIQAPGIDPLQLIVLLSSVQWSDAATSADAVVTEDSTGQHTSYRLAVSLDGLAQHLLPVDRMWVTAMAAEAVGRSIRMDVSVSGGRIVSMFSVLPLPAWKGPVPTKGNVAPMPSRPTLDAVVGLTIDYTKSGNGTLSPSTGS